MTNRVIYPDSFSLGENWKENPEQSFEIFTEKARRVARFIDKVTKDPNLKLVDLKYSVEIVTEFIENDSKEKLDTDFWVSVANGATYE